MTTEAALKAWKTRRANGWVHPKTLKTIEIARQAKVRSDGAKKAWVTRKKTTTVADDLSGHKCTILG
jgi:hypothetical protein